MSPEKQNLAIIIAGPNGAGKTTFASEFLPKVGCTTFINADLIAKGLAPLRPESEALRAGKIMLELLDEYAAKKESFAVETTLSGRTYLPRIAQWQAQGYRVILAFLALPSVDDAIARVALRVSQKGHNIPEPVIRRRFAQGLVNFEQVYKPIVDEWVLYNNLGPERLLLAHGTNP